jgi:uncharacterized protein YbaP (TraB family)
MHDGSRRWSGAFATGAFSFLTRLIRRTLPPLDRLLLGVLAAFIGGQVHAQAAASAPDCPPDPVEITKERLQAGMQAAEDHGFLWRISKGGRVSYLYGTVHIARLEWVFPGPLVREALAASDTVALELDILDPEVQRRLVQAMSARPDEALPEALVERLRRGMAAECLAPESLAKASPELQVATLSALAGRRDGLYPTYSVDLLLASYARGLRKAVVSLETPETQVGALQMPTREETVAFVEDALEDLESGRTRPFLLRLATLWANGDHDALEHYEDWCECRRTAAERLAMQRLLDDRNPGMAEQIDRLHRSGRRVFAAVGSLHMVGPTGLPALLKQRGYTVEVGHFEEPEAPPPKAQ